MAGSSLLRILFLGIMSLSCLLPQAFAQCDCGEELNSTGSCVFVAGINVTAGRQCNLGTDRFCSEDTDEGVARCECGCYWEGALCDQRVAVDAIWPVIAIGVPLLLILGVVGYLFWRTRNNGGSDWDYPPSHCVVPPYKSIGHRPLLAYRLGIAVMAVVIQVVQLEETEGQALRAFTVWNWFLLTTYFCIGLGLSIKHEVAPSDRKRLNALEKVYYGIMVAEVVSVPLVAVVFWGLLFPSASPAFRPFLTSGRSLIQHGFNVPIMYLDFMLISLPIRYWMYVFVMLWAAGYCFFHSSEITAALSYENDFRCEVYFFLKMDSPLFLPWAIGLLVAYLLFHVITVKLSDLKLRFQEDIAEAEDSKEDAKVGAVGL